MLSTTPMGALVDLQAALRDAPRKDAGFSAMTLAWVLRSFDVPTLAGAVGWTETRALRLDTFRLELIELLTRTSRPE